MRNVSSLRSLQSALHHLHSNPWWWSLLELKESSNESEAPVPLPDPEELHQARQEVRSVVLSEELTLCVKTSERVPLHLTGERYSFTSSTAGERASAVQRAKPSLWDELRSSFSLQSRNREKRRHWRVWTSSQHRDTTQVFSQLILNSGSWSSHQLQMERGFSVWCACYQRRLWGTWVWGTSELQWSRGEDSTLEKLLQSEWGRGRGTPAGSKDPHRWTSTKQEVLLRRWRGRSSALLHSDGLCVLFALKWICWSSEVGFDCCSSLSLALNSFNRMISYYNLYKSSVSAGEVE